MSNYYCFVCASDEGVFLDVAANTGDTIQHHLQTCLSIQIDKQRLLSSKICHKCVYELNQCNNFVEKYKQRLQVFGKDTSKEKLCCNFCTQPSTKGCLFDLTKDNHSQDDVFHHIRKIFKDYPICDNNSTLICLSCRYTLDLLVDLRSISADSEIKLKKLIEENVDYLTLPKTKTFVASRKTTVKISTATDFVGTDTNISTMARGNSCVKRSDRKRSASTSKTRTCDECRNSVEDGMDMYRFHRTGLTVCKTCWVSIDPGKNQSSTQTLQTNINTRNTKRCSVFLKDVLKDKTTEEKQPMKVVSDSKGNKVYIISDESSEDEEKRRNKRLCRNASSDENSQTADEGEKRSLRSGKICNQTGEDRNNSEKRSNLSDHSSNITDRIKEKEKGKLQKMAVPVSAHKNSTRKLVSSDSEISVLPTLRNKKQRKRHSDVSESESESSAKKTKNSRNLKSSKSANASEESSSSEEMLGNKAKVTRLSSATLSLNTNTIVRKRGRPRSKSCSIPSVSSGFKRPSPKSVKFSKMRQKKVVTIVIEDEDVSETQPHNCSECGAIYDNKLVGLTHELTHYKQLQLKLEKVKIAPHNEEKESASETTEKVADQSEEQTPPKEDLPDQEDKDKSQDCLSVQTTMSDSTTNVDENVENMNLETPQTDETSSKNKDTITENLKKAECESKESVVEDNSTVIESANDKVVEQKENIDVATAVTEVSNDEKTCQETISKEEGKPSTLEDNDSVPVTNSQSDVEDIAAQHAEESSKTGLNNVEKDEKDVPNKETGDVEMNVSTEDESTKKTMNESIEKEEAENDSAKNVTEGVIEADAKSDDDKIQLVEGTDAKSVDVSTSENNIDDDKIQLVEETDAKSMNVSILENSMDDDKIQLVEGTDAKSVDVSTSENNIDDDKIQLVEEEENDDSMQLKTEDDNSFNDVEENKKKPEEKEKEAIAPEEKEKEAIAPEEKSNDEVQTELCELISSENFKEQDLQNESRLNDSATDVADVLREVFDLASSEIEKRFENIDPQTRKELDSVEETLENISLELYNGGDMPSLEPINTSDINKKDESVQ